MSGPDVGQIEEDPHSFDFKACEPEPGLPEQTLLILDSGETSHIRNTEDDFKSYDNTFDPSKHFKLMALAKTTLQRRWELQKSHFRTHKGIQ